MAKARIYKPTKTAMQSGTANTKKWVLRFVPKKGRFIEPIMGWTGSSDMDQEIELKFGSKEDAAAYAERQELDYEVIEPNPRKIKPQSYADNFQ